MNNEPVSPREDAPDINPIPLVRRSIFLRFPLYSLILLGATVLIPIVIAALKQSDPVVRIPFFQYVWQFSWQLVPYAIGTMIIAFLLKLIFRFDSRACWLGVMLPIFTLAVLSGINRVNIIIKHCKDPHYVDHWVSALSQSFIKGEIPNGYYSRDEFGEYGVLMTNWIAYTKKTSILNQEFETKSSLMRKLTTPEQLSNIQTRNQAKTTLLEVRELKKRQIAEYDLWKKQMKGILRKKDSNLYNNNSSLVASFVKGFDYASSMVERLNESQMSFVKGFDYASSMVERLNESQMSLLDIRQEIYDFYDKHQGHMQVKKGKLLLEDGASVKSYNRLIAKFKARLNEEKQYLQEIETTIKKRHEYFLKSERLESHHSSEVPWRIGLSNNWNPQDYLPKN